MTPHTASIVLCIQGPNASITALKRAIKEHPITLPGMGEIVVDELSIDPCSAPPICEIFGRIIDLEPTSTSPSTTPNNEA